MTIRIIQTEPQKRTVAVFRGRCRSVKKVRNLEILQLLAAFSPVRQEDIKMSTRAR